MRPDNRQYFAEVDGLRAVAVLSVLLFHLDFSGVSGGFVGVDIFFVISGFLITRNIVEDVSARKFKFSRFYYRRFRRLFPALCFTIFVTLFIGVLLLSPGHLERLSKSVLYAVLSISNIYFWNESGYFDVSSSFKPLLHFWSLAVEEQFYLIWPASLVLLLKLRSRGYILAALLIIGAISIVASQKMLGIDPSAAFYLTPFRMGEFAIGALCVWCLGWHLKVWQLEAGLMAGFIVIGYAVFTFDSETAFPGFNSLIPGFGAAIVILTCRAPLLGWILRVKPIVRIGLISYSLYLIHWPVLVYYSYWKSSSLTMLEKSVLLGVSIILADLMYRYIEQKFRYKSQVQAGLSPWQFVSALSLVLVIMVIPAVHMALTDGWAWRVSESGMPDSEVSAYKCRDSKVSPEYERRCTVGAVIPGPARVLLVGDSHANQLITAADFIGKKSNLKVDVWTFPGCPPLWGVYKIYGANSAKIQEICKDLVPKWEKTMTGGGYDYIIIAGRWMSLYESTVYGNTNIHRDYLVDRYNPIVDSEVSRQLFRTRMAMTVEKIHSNNAKVIIFSQVPLLGRNIQDCNNVPDYIFSDRKIKERCDGNVTYDDAMGRLKYTNEVIQGLASENTLVVIPSDYLCSHSEKKCNTVVSKDLIYKDMDHLSRRGSLLLARHFGRDVAEFLNRIN